MSQSTEGLPNLNNPPITAAQLPEATQPPESDPVSTQQDVDNNDPEQISLELQMKITVAKQLQAILDTDDRQLSSATVESLETALVYLIEELGCRTDISVFDIETAAADQDEIYDADDNASIWEDDDQAFMQDLDEVIIQEDVEDDVEVEDNVDNDIVATTDPVATVKETGGSQPVETKPLAAEIPAATTAQLAPNRPPVHGTFSQCGVPLIWSNNNGTDKSRVASALRSNASNYKRLSDGKLVFKPTVKAFKTGSTYFRKNLNSALNRAVNAVGNFDRYAIYTPLIGTSHAGRKVAFMKGTLYRDQYHENGHILPNDGRQVVLGHSGRYVTLKGKRVLDAYGDPSSFMGRFGTNQINPPQRYWVGWAGDNKTGQYKSGDGTQTYNMEPYFHPQTAGNLTGVYLPRDIGRPLFVGIIPVKKQLVFGVWDVTGGGTQRELIFNKTATVAGLTFTRIQNNGSYAVLQISPEVPASATASVDKPHKARPIVRAG